MNAWIWVYLACCAFLPPVIGLGGQRIKWWIEDRRWNAYVDAWYERLL